MLRSSYSSFSVSNGEMGASETLHLSIHMKTICVLPKEGMFVRQVTFRCFCFCLKRLGGFNRHTKQPTPPGTSEKRTCPITIRIHAAVTTVHTTLTANLLLQRQRIADDSIVIIADLDVVNVFNERRPQFTYKRSSPTANIYALLL